MSEIRQLSDKELTYEYRTILQTPHFTWISSLGQIVPGYSLLFAKQKIINFSQLSADLHNELISFLGLIVDCTQEYYGYATIFEQGATTVSSPIGCGVNQAHLHIVAISGDLLVQSLQQNYAMVSEHEDLYACLKSHRLASSPYILHCDMQGKTRLFSYGQRRESQAVRRIICRLTGSVSHWDWKIAPTISEAVTTHRVLSDAARHRFH